MPGRDRFSLRYNKNSSHKNKIRKGEDEDNTDLVARCITSIKLSNLCYKSLTPDKALSVGVSGVTFNLHYVNISGEKL